MGNPALPEIFTDNYDSRNKKGSEPDADDSGQMDVYSESQKRYPRRIWRAKQRWWDMAGITNAIVEVTTSYDPKLEKILAATPTEREQC